MKNILNNPTQLPLILPSIFGADFGRMYEEVADVLSLGADGLHIDIMDGHFAPNLSMGPIVPHWIRTQFPHAYFDVHLMVEHPEDYIEPFAKAGANNLTFHIEATLGRRKNHERDVIARIRDLGCQAGVAINPSTPAQAIEHLLGEVDLVLVMSVHPGYSGQAFIPEVLEKTRWIKDRIGDNVRLEMDGGLGPDTIVAARDAGVDAIVAASALFGASDRGAVMQALRG